jgi:DNA-binding protein HU-beta
MNEGGKTMRKDDLAKFVSERAGITAKAGGEAVDAVFEGIASGLQKGGPISIMGFGSFKVVARAAREGRNPRTGEKIQIPASKTVKFTPGKSLKKQVQ